MSAVSNQLKTKDENVGTHRVLAFVLLTIALALLGVLMYTAAAPQLLTISDSVGGATVNFSADRDRVLLPNECVNVSWQVDGVQAVYLNGAGVIGAGTQTVCESRGIIPKLRIIAADGTSALYSLRVDILALNPNVGLLIAAAVGLALLAFRFGWPAWFMRYGRRTTSITLLLGAGAIVAALAHHFFNAAPMVVDTTYNGAHVYFAIDHTTTLQKDACFNVRWDTEAIEGVELNSEGVLGSGERQVCGADFTDVRLRVQFRDGTNTLYRIKVNSMLYIESGLLLALAGLMAAVGIDGLLRHSVGATQRVALRISLNRYDITILVGLVALTLAVFGPVIYRMVYVSGMGTDFAAHLGIAGEMAQGIAPHPLYRFYSHFLFHLLIAFLTDLIPGLAPQTAEAIVVLFFYAALLIAVYFVARSTFGAPKTIKRALAYGAVAFIVVIAAPVTILTWNERSLYYGYTVANAYHNPTVSPLKPFALVLFLYAVRVFANSDENSSVALPAALSMLATLLKPSYAIALLPALALVAGYRLLTHQRVNWRLLILGLVAPTSLILLWQYYAVYGSGAGGQIIWWPFELYRRRAPGDWRIWLVPQLVMSALFPFSVTLLYFRAVWRELTLRLAWLIFAIAAAYQYLLVQTQGLLAGDFLWGAQVGLFILFLYTLLFFLRQSTRKDWRFWPCALALALHVVCGIVWYYANLPILTNWTF